MSKIVVGEISAIVREAYEVSPKNCIMLWGPPGIGKTEAIYDVGKELKKTYPDFFVITMITSQMESIDFSMPAIVEVNGTKTYVKLPIKDFVLPKDARGIIFFDELPNAAPDVQKAAQSILTDRKIHEHKIPDGVMVVAAGNRKEDRAGSNNLLSALANRLEHYDVMSDFEDWAGWAIRSGVHHSVVGYLKYQPKNLFHFDANVRTNPTPRVWEVVSRYMHYYDNHPSKLERVRVASRVGDAIAGEFAAYCRTFEKFPTKEQIKKDPEKAALPKEGDVQYSLTIACINWTEKNNAEQMIEYILRMNKEFQAMYFTQMKKHYPEKLAGQKKFTKWASDNLSLLADSK